MTTPITIPCKARGCVHYRGLVGPPFDGVFVCYAFPLGIPKEVLEAKNDHTSPIPGDEGITFQQGGIVSERG